MKEGDKFKVIADAAGFDVGVVVTFTRYEEDNHTIAWFTGTTKFNDVDEWPVILTKVVPYVEEKELNGDGLYVVIKKESDFSHHFEIGTLVRFVEGRGGVNALYREVGGTMDQILEECEVAPYVEGRTILVSSKETTPTTKALYGEEEEEVDKYATWEERGWKEGDLFTYISDDGFFPEGDIIELINDDGTYMPLFRSVKSGYEYFVYTFKVEPYVAPVEDSEEYTGGSSDYYKVVIKNPTTFDPYVAECNDIIEALDMNFAEGNIFKALWRKAAARQGKRKAGHNEQYDNEKILFFAQRLNGLRGE